MADVNLYRGARLRDNYDASSRCSVCRDPNTMFTCVLSDGSTRIFHTRCLPTGLLMHATASGCYYDHITGLADEVRRAQLNEVTYLQSLDVRLKQDCAAMTQWLDSRAASPRDIGLFLDTHERIASQLECNICLDKVAYQPVSTGCHVFCRHCWVGWVLSSTTATQRTAAACPVCRDTVRLSSVVKCDRLLQRLIGCLQVRCSNHSAGCRATMEYGVDGDGLQTHVQTCAHHSASCQQCGWTGLRSQQSGHRCAPPQSSCPNPGCSFVGSPPAVSQHVSRCQYVVIRCDACREEHPRHLAAYHQQRDCLYRCAHCHRYIAKTTRELHQRNPNYRLCCNFHPCENGCGQPVLDGVQDKHDDTCNEANVNCNECGARCKRKNFDKHWDKVHQDDMDY